MVLLFAVVGCGQKDLKPAGSSDQDYLAALADLEKDLLKDFSSLDKDFRTAYQKWETDKISRDEFNGLCEKEYIPRINEIKAKYKEFITAYPIPDTLEKNPDFIALNNGKLLRSDVGIFLVKVIKGHGVLKQMPADGKVGAEDIVFQPVSDEELKKLNKEFMIDNFDSHFKELQKGLSKYNKE